MAVVSQSLYGLGGERWENLSNGNREIADMRYRLIGSLLLCLFSASMFAAKFSANTTDLRVGESATRFSLQKEGAIVKLALENSRASALPAQIKLELINPRETIRATAMQEISIPSGSSISTIPLIKVGSSDYDSKELLWYRLRYRISVTDPSGKEPDSISGVISLSEITPDVFRLLVSAPQEVGKEAKYTIRVRTLHPLTGKPIGGMDVQSQMSYEEGDDERKLKSSSVTNLNGEALLEFKLPSPLKADEAEVKVVAERVASRGYRMMLAEIGLPPGADVDRASLEQAVKESGWDLNHYDVLPDRVVV